MESNKKCCVEGCENIVKGKRMCSKHGARMQRYGDVNFVKQPKHLFEHCTYDGCSEKHYAHGLCRKHWRESEDRKKWVKEYNKNDHVKQSKAAYVQMRRMRTKLAAKEFFLSKEVFERDEWICQLCGLPVDKELKYPNKSCASLDHILPISKGGSHTKENCQLAHLFCNLKKGDRDA